MITKLNLVLLGVTILVLPSFAGAVEHQHDKSVHAMNEILKSYLEIQNSLSNDSLIGVSENAKNFATQVEKLSNPQEKKSLDESVRTLMKADELKSARQAFKSLSSVVTAWARKAKPAGVQEYFCSMAEAGWLQKTGETANPYFGKEMRGCGEKRR